MLQEGLEPPCRKTTDPKSVASANFATRALNYGGEGTRTPYLLNANQPFYQMNYTP